MNLHLFYYIQYHDIFTIPRSDCIIIAFCVWNVTVKVEACRDKTNILQY